MCHTHTAALSEELRKNFVGVHFADETKFRLIDDSKAQFENDVADNLVDVSCLMPASVASAHFVRLGDENTFVCFDFKDLFYCRLIFKLTPHAHRHKKTYFLSQSCCTRKLPHRRCIFV